MMLFRYVIWVNKYHMIITNDTACQLSVSADVFYMSVYMFIFFTDRLDLSF